MGIGEKIKERRTALGWSQQKLADMMGYTSKSTITKIEKGVSDVGQRNIEKFASVLGVSIAYLMDWEESENETDTFISGFQNLSDSHQKAILEYITFLSAQEQSDDGQK